ESLSAKRRAALGKLSVIHVDAGLERKNRLETASQIFLAGQPPATAVDTVQRVHVDSFAAAYVGLVMNTVVDLAIERDAALAMRDGTGQSHERADNDFDFFRFHE